MQSYLTMNRKIRQSFKSIKDNLDWEEIQTQHDKGMLFSDIQKKYGLTVANINTALKHGYLIKNEEMSKISIKTKAQKQMLNFWENTPDKGRERIIRSQNSKPCKNVKHFLIKHNIDFIEEYNPNVPNRYFYIDIALPDKMIGIEINGSYHYTDKEMKSFTDYHINRQQLIEQLGWKIININTKLCFNFEIDYWNRFINDLLNYNKINTFDYLNFKNVNIYDKFCECGQQINPNKTSYIPCCYKCAGIKRRKIPQITKEEFLELRNNYYDKDIAKLLNVGRSTIYKFIKHNNIPSRRTK